MMWFRMWFQLSELYKQLWSESEQFKYLYSQDAIRTLKTNITSYLDYGLNVDWIIE